MATRTDGRSRVAVLKYYPHLDKTRLSHSGFYKQLEDELHFAPEETYWEPLEQCWVTPVYAYGVFILTLPPEIVSFC